MKTILLLFLMIVLFPTKPNPNEAEYFQVDQQATEDMVNTGFCKQYRVWQVKFIEEITEILADSDPKGNLSWETFLNIKGGNNVPSIERRCARVPRLSGSVLNLDGEL